jgi:hypothetical protein
MPFTTDFSELAANSSAATALIWWLVPLAGVIGALGYILWVSKLRGRLEKGTARSVNQFEKFQNSFRDAEKK